MEKIAPVNGLRGLAVLFILFSRVTHDMFSFGPFISSSQLSLAPAISNSWTGIDLLVFLSGFVLFLPYADGRRTMTSGAEVWMFYRRRFVRLMPLYYLAAAVELIVAPKSWLAAAWLLSGLFDLSPSSTTLSNWPLWLVDIAIIFSIIFPVLVWAWHRVGSWRLVLLVMLLALLTRVLAYGVIGIPFMFTLWSGADGLPYAPIGIIGHLDEFVLGMLVAHLRAAGANDRSSALLIWPGLLTTLAAWLGLGYLGIAQGYWQAVLSGSAISLLAIGYALIVAAVLSQRGWLSRLLSFRPLQLAGMMSYSIFVWHVPILHLLRPSRAGNIAFIEGSILYLVAVFLVAAISYCIIEFPRVKPWRSLFLLPQRKLTAPQPLAHDGRSPTDGLIMTPQAERRFLFVFRMFAGWLFLFASLSEVHNPAFMTTHVVPVLSHPGAFHPFFSIFAASALLPVVTVLVSYGHLLIGLSLLSGLMIRVSASAAIGLLMLYWLAAIDLPGFAVAGHPISSAVFAFRIFKYGAGLVFDTHILYSFILLYLIAGRAGHVVGLDGWVVKRPVLMRYRGLRALV